MSVQATDACRFPVLSDQGRDFLRSMREHPQAPRFRDASGHRLREDEIDAARDFHREEIARPACAESHPSWLDGFLAGLRRDTPFFRVRDAQGTPFPSTPTTSRGDLANDIAAFVPDPMPVDRLIRFDTTGTTGHRIVVPSHPTVAARHLAFLRKALRPWGIVPEASAGRVSIVLAGFQDRCFTYCSVNPLSDEAGVIKLNLNPADWNHPDDRARYLDAMRPELVSGDPLSLPELASLGMTHTPRAAFSTSMALSPGLRADLEARLRCPVIDVYSLNESGPVAAKRPGDEAFHLLQSGLLVELVDEAGHPVPDGERGEICLTGGYNGWLPLCRYRTGDWARRDPRRPDALLDLEGRAPVRFLDGAGAWRNNIEISQALAGLPLSRFSLAQGADGSLELFLPDGVGCGDEAAGVVAALLGRAVVRRALVADDKVLAYASGMR